MKFNQLLLSILALIVIQATTALAKDTSQFDFPHGRVELLVQHAPKTDGSAVRVSAHFTLEEGWHIYGEKPGDVGLPTEITWHLPAGATASALNWPEPKTFSYAGFKSLGYERELTVSSTLSAADRAAISAQPIKADISWVLCNDSCIPGEASLTALTPPAPVLDNTSSTVVTGHGSLALVWAILGGLVGGLLLNFMPCVFPVLSLKILSLVEQSDPVRARRHSHAFAGGVILSFWSLAVLLMILRSTGQQLGWGFQFQSPTFVAAMVVILLLVALNLLGVFEIGTSVQNLAGRADRHDGLFGSFLSGVLATAVATPCTAPVMGTAIAFALSRSTVEGMLIFTALGVGMASPFVVLSYAPKLMAFLPRPGAWMVTLKQILAFPLLASVVWLLWVLRSQVGSDSVFTFELGLVILSLGAWTYGRLAGPQSSRRVRRSGVAAFAFTIALTCCLGWPLNALSSEGALTAHGASQEKLPWEPFSVARLNELRSQHRAVLVDFTAAWCLMCQVNHRVAFQSSEVAERFKQKNVAFLRGDWTNRSELITSFMRDHGRDGVPLDLFFSDREATPIVLPALLTPGELLSLVE